jgi:hypothetical protein
MPFSDTYSLIGFLESAWQIAAGVLRLNPQAYEVLLALPNGLWLALFILLLASLSYAVGHIVVLFANRIDRRHLLPGLAGASLALVFSAFFWAGSIGLAADIFFETQQSMEQVFLVVAISFAPLLFGFLILAPYLGNIIFYGLRIWVFLAVIAGTMVTFQFSFWQALICSALGWIVMELLTRLPFLQIRRFSTWLWRMSTGIPEQLQPGEIVNKYVDQAKQAAEESDES